MIDCTKEALFINIDMIFIRSNYFDKDLEKLCKTNPLRIAYNYKKNTNFASKFKPESPQLILFYSEFKDVSDFGTKETICANNLSSSLEFIFINVIVLSILDFYLFYNFQDQIHL